MIYKDKKIKDWVFWLDWFMVFFSIFLWVDIPSTLVADNWGLDSWYMHKFLILGIGYMCMRLYINQSRMYRILRREIKFVSRGKGVQDE